MEPGVTARARRGDESGAVLILALVFVLAVGLLTGVLINLVETNILSTTSLGQERSLEYASDGALQVAVQAIRHAAPGACNSGQVVQVNANDFGYAGSQVITVWCTEVDIPSAPPIAQRQVTFCAGITITGCSTPAPPGELARAQVLYQDVAPNGTQSAGRALSIESWSIDVASH